MNQKTESYQWIQQSIEKLKVINDDNELKNWKLSVNTTMNTTMHNNDDAGGHGNDNGNDDDIEMAKQENVDYDDDDNPGDEDETFGRFVRNPRARTGKM